MTFGELIRQRNNLSRKLLAPETALNHVTQIFNALQENTNQLVKYYPKEYNEHVQKEAEDEDEDTDEEYEAPEKYELCRFCCDTYIDVNRPHLKVSSRICCPDCKDYAFREFKET